MSQYDPEPPGGPGNAPPPPSYSGPTTTEAPKPVRQAVTMLFVLIALNVLSTILTLTSSDSDAATAGGGIFGSLVFIALYTWLTLMVRNGKNWARITITVLFVLGILLGVITLAVAVPVILKLLTALQMAVQIAILVLLFSRASSEYFAAARRPA
jgi:apolipoprotein N-acyltransferase